MCKIFVMAGIKSDAKSQELLWKLIPKMGKEMSFQNKDGLGYALVSHSGKVLGERWHNNDDAFVKRNESNKFEKEMAKRYKGFLDVKVDEVPYAFFGSKGMEQNYTTAAIALHTRMATSGKEFTNTHPFFDEETETSLIHNGVIHNIDKGDLKRSTCDSEKILNKYLEYNVRNNPKNIQKVANDLSGYYACGVLSQTKDGQRIIDVFKDSTANLTAAYIQELDALAITTSIRDLEDACKEIGLTLVKTFGVEKGMLLRMDALTGNVLALEKFDPTGIARTWNTGYNNNGYNSSAHGDYNYWKDKHKNKKTDLVIVQEKTGIFGSFDDKIEILDESEGWVRDRLANVYRKIKVG